MTAEIDETPLIGRGDPPIPAETIRLPVRGFAIDRRKAFIASAVLWAGFAVVVFFVTNHLTQPFDDAGLEMFRTGADRHLVGPRLFAESVRDVTALGGVLLRNLFAIAAVVALLFLRLRREAVLFVVTVGLGWIVNSGLKLLVGRARPDIVPHLMEAGGNSFPSGHSFNSAVIYIAMALAFASLSHRASVRYTLVATGMVVSAAIAWSRVLLGVHFPSDVIAGWLGGAGWAMLSAALFYRPARMAADSETAQRIDPAERMHRAVEHGS